jgi:hypothetical protein
MESPSPAGFGYRNKVQIPHGLFYHGALETTVQIPEFLIAMVAASAGHFLPFYSARYRRVCSAAV